MRKIMLTGSIALLAIAFPTQPETAVYHNHDTFALEYKMWPEKTKRIYQVLKRRIPHASRSRRAHQAMILTKARNPRLSIAIMIAERNETLDPGLISRTGDIGPYQINLKSHVKTYGLRKLKTPHGNFKAHEDILYDGIRRAGGKLWDYDGGVRRYNGAGRGADIYWKKVKRIYETIGC